jgi:L-rhamnose-H+ transport protein
MTSTILGMLTLVIAGVMNASFPLPIKYTGRWAWENTWLAWTFFALILLPSIQCKPCATNSWNGKKQRKSEPRTGMN